MRVTWMLLLLASLSMTSAGVVGESVSLIACDNEYYHAPGDIVRAKVGFGPNRPIDGLRAWICWDERLEYVDCEWTNFWPDQLIEPDPNGLYIECTGAETRDPGTACTLVFRIRGDAESGYAWLSFRETWPSAQLLAGNFWWTVGRVIYWPARATPLGDMNCDGSVNALDIFPFVAALSGDVAYDLAQPICNRLLADCNADGSVDAGDIDAFIDLLLEQ